MKDLTERSVQREKMYRHIAEICDREARESIHEWHRCRRERAVDHNDLSTDSQSAVCELEDEE